LDNWELVNAVSNSQAKYTVSPKITQVVPEIMIMIAKHYDGDPDKTIVDGYQIFLWIKDVGIGVSAIYKTQLHHPVGLSFYNLELAFDVELGGVAENMLLLKISASNHLQPWHKSKELLFIW
jgi:hypothetical protein